MRELATLLRFPPCGNFPLTGRSGEDWRGVWGDSEGLLAKEPTTELRP